jgi:hypothetical protein
MWGRSEMEPQTPAPILCPTGWMAGFRFAPSRPVTDTHADLRLMGRLSAGVLGLTGRWARVP